MFCFFGDTFHHPFDAFLRWPSPLRSFYTKGFSRFVASTTVLIATGWSDSCRVGFAPTEKQRLCTAYHYKFWLHRRVCCDMIG